jgi:predicted ATPase/two-component SAPR family response regulator
VNAHIPADLPPFHPALAAWSPLIGREQDIAILTHNLPQQRLVTLWGPGGCGKTRLAMQVAQDLQDTFSDGCRFVDCGDLREPDLLTEHVRTTVDLYLADGSAPLAALIEWLRTRSLLLVLDNGEHLLDACAQLVTVLLVACPHLHVLVTSRVLLNLPGEQTYHVKPLTLPPSDSDALGAAVPPHKDLEDWESAATYTAIQLFVQRAQMAQSDFHLTRGNVSLVVSICRLLDGLPLAIELAAARVRMLALEQLAEQLAHGVTILGAGSRLAPARQQTVQATINWSYQLLTEQERRLFRRLAVAASSFDLSLVEALGEGLGEDGAATDIFAHLIDKSLVTVVSLDGAARYRLLDTIRHFGLGQVRQSGEMEATHRLYGAWVCRLAQQAGAEIGGPAQTAWLARLDTEIEHVRAVVRWMLEQHQAAAVIDISAALVPFCEQRAHVGEATQWLETALAMAEVIDVAAEGRALHALGVLNIRRYRADQTPGYLTQAQDYLTRARDRYAQLADQAGVASAWYHLGDIEFWRADYQAARTHLEAGLKIVPKEAVALRAGLFHRLSNALCGLGAFGESTRLLRKALILRRQAGDINGLALTLSNLGGALTQQGEYAQAKEVLRESLRHFGDLGDRNGYLLALVNLAEVALALEDHALIQDHLAVALSSTWVECEMWLVLELFDCLARMALNQGRLAHAAQLFGYIATLKHERSDQLPTLLQAQLKLLTPEQTGHLSDRRSSREQCAIAWRDGQLMGLEEAFACALDGARSNVGGQEDAALIGAGDDEAVAVTAGAHALTTTPTLGAPIRITAFERGIVERDAQQTVVNWHYSKARELLFFLVDAPQRTRGQIVLALWPDAAEEQASTHMRVTLYHLRKTLGNPALVLRTHAGYEFNRALPYWYDVERFESLIDQAQAVKETYLGVDSAKRLETSIGLLAEACALYRADYLADLPPQEWIIQRQAELRRRYIEAQFRLGMAYQDQGNHRQALACYQSVTSYDPYHEQAHAAILRCYVLLEQRSQAIRYYRDLRAYLREELGVAPDPHITSYVKTLLTQADMRP